MGLINAAEVDYRGENKIINVDDAAKLLNPLSSPLITKHFGKH